MREVKFLSNGAVKTLVVKPTSSTHKNKEKKKGERGGGKGWWGWGRSVEDEKGLAMYISTYLYIHISVCVY